MFSSNESYLRLDNEPDYGKAEPDTTETCLPLSVDPKAIFRGRDSKKPEGMEVTEIEVTAPPEIKQTSVDSPPILNRLSWETPDPPNVNMAPTPVRTKGSWEEAIAEQPSADTENDAAIRRRKFLVVAAWILIWGMIAIVPLAVVLSKQGNGGDGGASAFSIGEEEEPIISVSVPSSSGDINSAPTALDLNPANSPFPTFSSQAFNGIPSPTTPKPTMSPSVLQVPATVSPSKNPRTNPPVPATATATDNLNSSSTPVPGVPGATGGRDQTEAPTKSIRTTPSPSKNPRTNPPVPATANPTPTAAPTKALFETPYVVASAAQAPSTPEPTLKVSSSSEPAPNSQAPTSVQTLQQQNSEEVFTTIVVATVPLWEEGDEGPSAVPSAMPAVPFAPLWAKGTPQPTPPPSPPQPTPQPTTPAPFAPLWAKGTPQPTPPPSPPQPTSQPTTAAPFAPLWAKGTPQPTTPPSPPQPTPQPTTAAPFAPLWAKGTPQPTSEPTVKPEEVLLLIGGSATLPTLAPSPKPTPNPSPKPTTRQPTKRPTREPTPVPTNLPTLPDYPEIPVQTIRTHGPTQDPWTVSTSDSPKPPTFMPTLLPELEIVTSEAPTFEPTMEETEKPKKNDKNKDRTDEPSRPPTKRPTFSPTVKAGNPTRKPTLRPTPPTDEMTFVPGLLTHEENGLILSQGLTARIIAVEGTRVPYEKISVVEGDRSDHWFHGEPDGAAVFDDPSPENPGGWIYVSNSEIEDGEGGVGAMVFDSEGRVIKYHRLLMGTSWNCGGGKTPWNTWISCEERDEGVIWQVDPTGQRMPEVITMGLEGGSWESFAFDIRNGEEPHFFVTEDDEEGALQRFTPTNISWSDENSMWNMLHGPGVVEYLLLEPSIGERTGTFSWGQSKEQAKENALNYYRHSEGIDVHEGIAYVVCKEDKWLFSLDLDRMTYTRHSTESGVFDGEPDQLKRILSTGGEEFLYFTEDGGDYAGVHGRDESGLFFTILESEVYEDETTGLAFSPDYRHMYIAYQENGLLFDVTRQDGHPFNARALDVKYHQPTEENLNHMIWRRKSNNRG